MVGYYHKVMRHAEKGGSLSSVLRADIIKMSVFVQLISSRRRNIIKLPNLVLWCMIVSQSVMQKDWFAVFQVEITVKVQNCIESLCIVYHLYH